MLLLTADSTPRLSIGFDAREEYEHFDWNQYTIWFNFIYYDGLLGSSAIEHISSSIRDVIDLRNLSVDASDRPAQPTVATDVTRTLRFAIGNVNFTDNGEGQVLEAPPFIEDGRTHVPLRVAVEALGSEETGQT